MSLYANFIGAGKIGITLAYLLQKENAIQVKGVCNQSKSSSGKAIQFIGSGTIIEHLNALPTADITFITTPDDHIQRVCEALFEEKVLKAGSIVLHCSGVLSSDVLAPAQAQGCFIASVHPMRSFANYQSSIKTYKGTYCAIEGDVEAVTILSSCFQKIGSIMIPVDKNKKPLYHVAAVFASNYIVTLAQIAQQCFTKAGIPASCAKKMTSTLMQSTLSNLTAMPPPEALTGPLKRGDIDTIQTHLQALSHTPIKSLYTCLGQATLPWVELPVEKKDILEQMFNT